MRFWAAILALVLSSSLAKASVPTPRPRPAELGSAAAPSAPAAPAVSTPEAKVETDQPSAGREQTAAPAPEAASSPSRCQLALKQIAVFTPHAPVKGPGACGIDDPVTLDAVTLPDEAQVAFEPPPLLRCDMATAITKWVRDDIVPIAAKLGSPLRGIENYDSYDCRGRNRVVGAKLSEHGRGNALDVRGLKLASGATVRLTDAHVSWEVREDLRKSACARFMTVLGPGSDGYHEEHVHVDLAVRHNGYTICQWDVRRPMDREAPSPLIASSRAPSPHEMVLGDAIVPIASATREPVRRHAAKPK